MSNATRQRTLAFVLACALAGAAHAHGDGDHDHDHGKDEGHAHGAHEHGVAHADVAIDADGATIELTVTGADLVGFEGKAADDAARAKLETGRKTLIDGAALFAFAPADGCKPAGPGELADAAAGDGKHDHDHDHDHAHADDAKSGDADAAASPADWRVTYRYTCEDGATLTGFSTAVFKAIPSLAEVRVQLVAPAAQAGATLTPQAPELRYAGD
jgi:hypothetical protein